MTIPTTYYAKSGAQRIAYQVIGNGPLDMVLVPGFVSNVDLQWEVPEFRRFLENLARFSRLVVFDKRGTGLSDRVASNELPTLETRMDDVRAVMDAVGIKSAVLFGVSEGGPMSMLFAATYPQRTRALVLYGTYASYRDDVLNSTALASFIDVLESGWGTGATLNFFGPSLVSDPRFVTWWARFERHSASPSAAVSLARMNAEINVRGLLASIRVPTLILHRRDDTRVSATVGRDLAAKIVGARYLELEGRDHLIFAGDIDAISDEIEEFVTGNRHAAVRKNVFATVVAIKAHDYGALPMQYGITWEHKWNELREQAHSVISMYGGVPFFHIGHELYAWFDGPVRAVRCALALQQTGLNADIPLACGVHIGEVERQVNSIVGATVDAARQLAVSAKRDQVLVSGVVRELTVGSGLSYGDANTSLALEGRQIPVFIADHVAGSAGSSPVLRQKLHSLSEREKEVLTLISLGLTNGMIADRLYLSEHTIKRHVANILLKLDLPNRAAAAAAIGAL